MADLRTTVTELVTGLGTLGYGSLSEAIAARPAEMVSVAPETWDLLRRAHEGGGLSASFEQAWSNGVAFAGAEEGLRGRRPILIEWKGSHRAPGDEVAPVDLRIDHVFLLSCKYLSKIMINASPGYLFGRLLQGGQGVRGGDWFAEVAAAEYQQLYATAVAELGWDDFPADVGDLQQVQRRRLSEALSDGWPGAALARYEELGRVVAHRTADLWQEALRRSAGRSPCSGVFCVWEAPRTSCSGPRPPARCGSAWPHRGTGGFLSASGVSSAPPSPADNPGSAGARRWRIVTRRPGAT